LGFLVALLQRLSLETQKSGLISENLAGKQKLTEVKLLVEEAGEMIKLWIEVFLFLSAFYCISLIVLYCIVTYLCC